MSELDPLYVHFNKIILAYLCSFSNEYALRQLGTLEKASIEILNLHIDSATSEELEELLNPSFYSSGVHYFNIKLKGIFEISDSSLQNLSKILFKRLSLIFSGKLVSKFDYQNAWQNFWKVISHFDNIRLKPNWTMEVTRCSLVNVWFFDLRSWIKLKECILEMFVNFHNDCFISASISIICFYESDKHISCFIWAKKHMLFCAQDFPFRNLAPLIPLYSGCFCRGVKAGWTWNGSTPPVVEGSILTIPSFLF